MPRFAPSRIEAALRLEIARQVIRESIRYGFPVTVQHMHAVHAAEADYDLATSLARP
jgi:hypothetical protein